jgi:hypothetical protein
MWPVKCSRTPRGVRLHFTGHMKPLHYCRLAGQSLYTIILLLGGLFDFQFA